MPSKAKPSHNGNTLELPPHSVEAEEAVLGSALMYPEALDSLAFLESGHFYLLRHGWIYDALLAVRRRGAPVDIRAVAEELRARRQLDEVGGEAYLSYLPTTVPTALHAYVYGQIVYRAHVRRRLLGAANDIAALAQDGEQDLDAVIDQAQRLIFQFQAPGRQAVVRSFADVITDFWSSEYEADGEPERLIATPFADLNRLIFGLEPGDFVVVAAKPSMGKSAMLWQMATHAVEQGARVLFFNLEMSDRQMVRRTIAQDTGKSTADQRREAGRSDDAQRAEYVTWLTNWYESARDRLRNLYTVELTTVNAPRIAALCREQKRQYGLDAVFIDYLQLIDNSDLNARNRTRELEQTSQALLNLALELDAPVVTGAQLSRIGDNRPTLEALRWGGIEQPATKVIAIHSDNSAEDYENRGEEPPERLATDLIVLKHRNGPKSPPDVMVWWNRKRVRFENAV